MSYAGFLVCTAHAGREASDELAAELIERYAARWSIEVAFAEAKNTTGVGEARNRTVRAVERIVPFGLMTQSIVIIWYHLSGHQPSVVGERRARERWYTTKRHPSYIDMIIKLRRVLGEVGQVPKTAGCRGTRRSGRPGPRPSPAGSPAPQRPSPCHRSPHG